MERELAVTETELWEAFDAVLQIQAIEEDEPGFKTVKELAEQYDRPESSIRKLCNARYKAGTLDRRRVLRTIDSRRLPVWAYRPVHFGDTSREDQGTSR